MASRCQVRFSRLFLTLLILSICIVVGAGKESGKDEKLDNKPKKKKDIRDYDDADMERLFMEWEEAEDEHDADDLLEHERPAPAIDLSQIDPSNPESALKLTKKGKTLMVFVSVSGTPTQEETEKITSKWQSMLFNANFQLQRYPVSSDRVIFMLKDGSLAWDIKDFLIQQDRCQEVSIEGQIFYGKGSGRKVDGKGKTIGVDDVEDVKSNKKTKSKKSQDKNDKLKEESKEDKNVPKIKPATEEKSKGKSPRSDSQDKKDDQEKPAEEAGLPESTFFRQADDRDDNDGDAVKRDEPGYHSARSKKAREKLRSYKSAEPLIIPSDFIDDNELPKAGLPESTFFRQVDDGDAVKRDEPGYHSARSKKAREKLRSYKSAEPLIIQSDFIDDNELPKEDKKKDEL